MKIGINTLSLNAAGQVLGSVALPELDITAPVIDFFSIGAPTGTDYPVTLDITETESLPVTVFGVVVLTSESAPNADQIIAGNGADDLAADFPFSFSRSDDGINNIDFGALPPEDYTAYVVLRDSAVEPNVSDVEPDTFTVAAVATGITQVSTYTLIDTATENSLTLDETNGGNTISIPAGTDRLLTIEVSWGNKAPTNSSPPAIVLGGQTPTLIGNSINTSASRPCISSFYLDDAQLASLADGGTDLTFDEIPLGATATAILWTGVNQASPVGSWTNSVANAASVSPNSTTANDDAIAVTVSAWNTDVVLPVAISAGGTKQIEVKAGATYITAVVATEVIPTAGAFSHTHTPTGQAISSFGAYSLNPA